MTTRHKKLGPGYLESIYENALALEFRLRKVSFQRQYSVPIIYLGAEVGMHRLDLLVENQIVVELKAVRNLEDIHYVIIRSYLKALNLKHGLILNFAKKTLEPKRVIFDLQT